MENQEPNAAMVWLLIAEADFRANKKPIVNRCDPVDIGGGWIVAMNGKREYTVVTPPDCMTAGIEFCHAAVWFNGWLAGLVAPSGGVIAGGEAANEDTLISQLEAFNQAHPSELLDNLPKS